MDGEQEKSQFPVGFVAKITLLYLLKLDKKNTHPLKMDKSLFFSENHPAYRLYY